MFIHHLATVSLISFSYVNNMVRVGSLVMCIHDASDVLLEVGRRSPAVTAGPASAVRTASNRVYCVNLVLLSAVLLESNVSFYLHSL